MITECARPEGDVRLGRSNMAGVHVMDDGEKDWGGDEEDSICV